ncbi:MAG: hypothetical protein INE96_04610, partial [Phenylobacterium sp.]
KALCELKAFGEIGSATPDDQSFVWTAIHGFSDLKAFPGAGDDILETQTREHARRCLQSL